MSDNVPAPQSSWETWLRIAARWSIFLAAAIYGVTFFAFSIYGMVREEWVEEMVKEHFAATIGLPSGALAALLLVTIFEINAGRVEFKVIGFEFKGAAGPIVMWVVCFLAIAISIRMLW
jgi:hypothetical protein